MREVDILLQKAVLEGDVIALANAVVDGADVNLQDNRPSSFYKGKAPLHIAVINGDIAVVDSLLDANAQINIGTDSACTPLALACDKGDETMANFLLSKGANIHVLDMFDQSILFKAANAGNADLCELLIRAGLDPNQKDKFGNTPLIRAAHWGNLEAVETIFNHNGDIAQKDNRGLNAFMHAAMEGHAEVVAFILKNIPDAEKTAIVSETTAQNSRWLYDNVPLIEQQDENGDTALMHVVRQGHFQTAKTLLLYAAPNVNAVNKMGETVLTEALRSWRVNEEILKALIEAGADVNKPNQNNQTPLMIAAERGEFEAVELLIANGADTLRKDNKGKTAVDYTKNKELRHLLKVGPILHASPEEVYKRLQVKKEVEKLCALGLMVKLIKKLPYEQAKSVYLNNIDKMKPGTQPLIERYLVKQKRIEANTK